MNGTDDRITVGAPLPRIAAARGADRLAVTVKWATGPRAGRSETVDLAPVVMTLRYYKPLRRDPTLFATVAISEDGDALVWNGGELDMAAVTVERLAAEAMSADDFRAFLARHHLTLDAAAAILGVSRRQIAYFVKGRTVPRLVALVRRTVELAFRIEWIVEPGSFRLNKINLSICLTISRTG